jgi:amino acid adenylation domain-containing protein
MSESNVVDADDKLLAEILKGKGAFSDKCLHRIFAERARELGDSIAVSAPDGAISYAELERRSTALGQELHKRGVGPDALVGLCVERSVAMVVGALAILKAGGAYVPIDPMYPSKRIGLVLGDSEVRWVVASSNTRDRLDAVQADILLADEAWPEADEPVEVPVSDSNLAYVIYTSGSTGVPKGVMVDHQSVVRLFTETENWFDFGKGDVWTMFHSIGFDFSVWELWGALLYGGRLVVTAHDVSRSPADFLKLLCEERVTVLNQTPSAFRQLISAAMTSGYMKNDLSLRYVIMGGEALDLDMLRPWIARFGDARPEIINMYGITETTVFVTYRRIVERDLALKGISPIGDAIADLGLHLLDEQRRPVAVGEPGEIYVSGPGVARGYLKRDELNAQRFVDINPDGKGMVRAYYSGDRAVRLPDGELNYLGRSDDQVKVRGFRIEPKEIEAVVAAHPDVDTAIVLPRDYGEGDVRIVAYVLPAGGEGCGRPFDDISRELTGKAATELPLHMRPSTYIRIPRVPLTEHGKIDKGALKCMESASSSKDEADLSRTEWELRGIWEEVLQRKDIGLKDDFFEIGGTSRALIRLLGRVNEHFGLALQVDVLAQEATIAALANSVATARKS